MKQQNRTTGAVLIFLGALLTVFFAVGLAASRDPGLFIQAKRYDYARESFVAFCRAWYIPCGIVGIPTLLITLIVGFIRGKKSSR